MASAKRIWPSARPLRSAVLGAVAAGCIALVAGLALVAGPAKAADTIDCPVSKIRLTSGNTNPLGVDLRFVDAATGTKGKIKDVKSVSPLESETVVLDNQAGKTSSGGANVKLKAGDEVWIAGEISVGDNFNCRKDNHRLVYTSGSGNTAKFKVEGGLYTKNRCKFTGNWDEICPAGGKGE